jgi:hypothetical protein
MPWGSGWRVRATRGPSASLGAGSLDLFGSLRLPHGAQDDKAVFFAEAREECKSGVRKIGHCPRCPILDMLCFEGVMQPKGHSLESC